ncbi:MAG: hypothetical protein ICV79_15410 [Flavisolibacter sp.]|nr:hypothetical protein [Flavisolibacter sp.]
MATIKTDIEPTDEKVLLPFHDFVLLLRQHGFSIKPEDYIELLKVVEKFGPQNALEGAPLICPLIATSPEEQDRFYKIVEEYKVQTEDKEPPAFSEKLTWWWKKNKRWVLGCFIVFCAALAAYLIFHKPKKPLSAVFVYDKKEEGDRKFRVGDTAELNGVVSIAPLPEAKKDVQFFWNTGNGFRQDSPVIRLPLNREGDWTVQLKIRSAVYPVEDSISTSTFHVCPEAPRLQLPLSKEDFKVKDELVITPAYASDQRFQNVYWKVNDSVVTAEEGTGALHYTFDSSGIYTVRFIGLLNPTDDENTPCTYIQTLENIAVNDDRYALRTQYSGQNIAGFGNKNLNPFLNWLLLLPALLISIGTWLWWKRKRKPEAVKKEEAPAAKEQKPPYETPFENKDLKLTEPEQAFQEVFRFFRQKAEDEITIFNVPKSIQQTIRSGGLPEMVFTNRMRYNDYVILIDRSLAKSMQVYLFDYLVKLFNEEAICVERFYYTGNFEKIFNESVPGGMSLKRLSELYKTYTLIIMGSAWQLVYSAYPVLDKNLADTLGEWEYKAILTPVPYKDWEDKEALIAKKFILLPADLQGQLKLIQAIREKQLDHKKYLSSISDFYETAYYDFTTIEDLKSYLDDDVLFQWLCAVAVFHKLRWEIVIETGKAVCTKHNAPDGAATVWVYQSGYVGWPKIEKLCYSTSILCSSRSR